MRRAGSQPPAAHGHRARRQWQDYIGCGKVSALYGGATSYGINLDLYSDNVHPISVAYPWFVVFPASQFSTARSCASSVVAFGRCFTELRWGPHNYRATEKICIGGKCLENPSGNHLGTDAVMTAGSVVSGTVTGSKCLHTSADGKQITEASADCGSNMRLPSGTKPACEAAHRGWLW